MFFKNSINTVYQSIFSSEYIFFLFPKGFLLSNCIIIQLEFKKLYHYSSTASLPDIFHLASKFPVISCPILCIFWML